MKTIPLHPLRRLAFGMGLLGSFSAASLEAAFFADFETHPATGAALHAGESIETLPGWLLLGGQATISAEVARSGKHSLRLQAGVPVTHLAILTPATPEGMDRLWVGFHLLPVVSPEEGVLTALSVVGAKLAFPSPLANASASTSREVLAFDATTGAAVPVALSPAPGGWLRLLFEVRGGQWRLHGDSGPVTGWLGLDDAGEPAIHWFGGDTTDAFLDDVQVAFADDVNPFAVAAPTSTPPAASTTAPSTSLSPATETSPAAPRALAVPSAGATTPTGFTATPPASTASTPAGEISPAAPPADELRIITAVYGSGTRFAEVTDRVRELLGRHDDTFEARPRWLKADPTPGWNKALVIVYEARGERHTFTTGEGGRVSANILLSPADQK